MLQSAIKLYNSHVKSQRLLLGNDVFKALMKKLLLTILIIVLCCSTLATCWVSAFADTTKLSSNINSYHVEEEGYDFYITSETDKDGNLRGMVSFSKSYFSASGIAVSVNIYSDENIDLNFNIGSNDLSLDQIKTRNKIVEIFKWIDKTVTAIDNAVNTQYETSYIYQYNQAECGTTLKIDEDTYQMLTIAQQMYELTNGAFNPATYRLVDLWGFSSRVYRNSNFNISGDRLPYDRKWIDGSYPLPDEKYITAFSNTVFTDFSNVKLTKIDGEKTTYYVTKNVQPAEVGDGETYQQWLDLGGIAKGYVVDLIRQYLTSEDVDVTNYTVDAGTSSQTYGYNANNGSWEVRIINPFDELVEIFPEMATLLGVDVTNKSVSTSGQYARKYTTEGVEYSHIIDGTRGAPAQTGIKSITLTFPDDDGSEFWACKADCLSTALTVLGRDGIVDFFNSDFCVENKIDVLAMYQSVDGSKQILSNVDQNEITFKADTLGDFSWNCKQVDGVWKYDINAPLIEQHKTNYTWLLIVIAVVVVALFTLVVVARYTIHKHKFAQNIKNAKKDKFFKPVDVMVYLAVALVIVILFSVFFDSDSSANQKINVVTIVDLQNNQTLFAYNLQRNEYEIAEDTSWQITVTQTENGIVVRLENTIDGETRFNELTITRGATPTAKMTDSLCGYHQDCVRNFGKMTMPSQSIVCSPNYLKVVTA